MTAWRKFLNIPRRTEDPHVMPPAAMMAGAAGMVFGIIALQITEHFIEIPPLYRNVGTAAVSIAYLVPFLVVRARVHRNRK